MSAPLLSLFRSPNYPHVFHRAVRPFVYHLSNHKVVLLFLNSISQKLSSVKAFSGDPFNKDEKTGLWKTVETEMKISGTDQNFHYWMCQIGSAPRRLRYYFEVTWITQEDGFDWPDGNRERKRTYRVSEKGLLDKTAIVNAQLYGESEESLFIKNRDDFHSDDCFAYPYISWNDDLSAPKWVPNTIWYQIFPERFANGDPSLNPPNTIEVWGSERPKCDSFFGGDLVGVCDKLPYLSELGITGLYTTPIFAAPSNHKYDTTDYFNIDPSFGSNAAFKTLTYE